MADKSSRGSLVLALLLGLVSGMITTVILAAIGAYLITGEKVAESAIGWISVAALLCGSAVSAAITAGKTGKMRPVMCLCGSGIYFLGLCALSAMLFDGVHSGVGVTILVILCGGLTVFLVGLGGRRKTKYKTPRYRY